MIYGLEKNCFHSKSFQEIKFCNPVKNYFDLFDENPLSVE